MMAVLAVLVTASVANAAPAKRQTVYYGDLNLKDPSGRALLDARLSQAARAVCWRPGDPRDTFRRAEEKRCMALALDRAYSAVTVRGTFVEVRSLSRPH